MITWLYEHNILYGTVKLDNNNTLYCTVPNNNKSQLENFINNHIIKANNSYRYINSGKFLYLQSLKYAK